MPRIRFLIQLKCTRDLETVLREPSLGKFLGFVKFYQKNMKGSN